MHEKQDALIIGGGPAGLTAAVYLARFRRDVIVIDNFQSRAAWIPESHNYPGFVNGLNGEKFLERLRLQATQFGAKIIRGTASSLEKKDDDFIVKLEDETVLSAQAVIIATGIVDIKPELPHMAEFIYRGAIRFCPVCDAYEAMGKKIAVIGYLKDALSKAIFLRTYSSNVALWPLDADVQINDEQKHALTEAGISVPTEPVVDLIPGDNCITALGKSGRQVTVDVLYPAMGAHVRTELALQLGASCNEEKHLHADTHQRTSVPGLYAIGDITTELHQISVAVGQASIAACAIHNSLPKNYD